MQDTQTLNVTDKFDVIIPKTNNFNEWLTKTNPEGVDLYEVERMTRTVPQFDKVDRNYNRNSTQPTGSYQIAIKAERTALADGMMKYLGDIKNKVKNFSEEDVQNIVRYIPNSRFAYYNKLIKQALSQGCHQGDVDYVDTVWMNDQAKASLKKLLNACSDGQMGFSVTPTPPKSNVRFQDSTGGKLAIPLKNPGYVTYKNDIDDESYLTKQVTKYAKTLAPIQNLLNQARAQIEIYERTKSLDELPMDPKFKRLIEEVRKSLYEPHMSYQKMMEISKAFSYIAESQQSKYLLTLLDPFTHRFTKIPTTIPMPSTSFSVRNNIQLTTNASGNVAFAWNPFYITDDTTSTFGVNNNVALLGTAASNFFLASNIGQTLPATLYSRYRLVSAAMKITFTSSLLNSQGFCTSSVDFQTPVPTTAGTAIAAYGQYGNFSLIENGYFKSTLSMRSTESLQLNYLPLDESFRDYQDVGTSKGGFTFAAYITGAPVSTTVARVDLVYNVEALVNNTFTDYLPTMVYTGSLDDMKAVNLVVSQTPSFNPADLSQTLSKHMPEKLSQTIYLPPDEKSHYSNKKTANELQQVRDQVGKVLLEQEKPSVKKSIWDSVLDSLESTASSLLESAGKYAMEEGGKMLMSMFM